jgi:hypothetical protein
MKAPSQAKHATLRRAAAASISPRDGADTLSIPDERRENS